LFARATRLREGQNAMRIKAVKQAQADLTHAAAALSGVSAFHCDRLSASPRQGLNGPEPVMP